MQRPFSIKIFLPDGNPEGLKIIEKSNWTGQGIVFNRSIYLDVRAREEFEKPGVYLLVGNSAEDSTLPLVYIGEADSVKPRFESHYSLKDFWHLAIFFIAKDSSLNKAHVKYLEARLFEIANKAKLCTFDNTQIPRQPSLSNAEKADAESFLTDMLNIFPLLGLSIFELTKKKPSNPAKILHISAKGLNGTGYESPGGFTVCKGSKTPLKETVSIHKSIVTLRKDLIKTGVLKKKNDYYEFSQDCTFTSPSTAATVVLARSANGCIEWKDGSGRPLKQMQEDATK